jgi:hypothetical protein
MALLTLTNRPVASDTGSCQNVVMKTHAKRTVYLTLTVLLSGLTWFWLHTLALVCFAPNAPEGFWLMASRVIAIAAGAVLGLPLGRAWWRVVYEEKRGGLLRKIR